jgi:cell division protein FtsA
MGKNYICAVDIGTSKIAACVAEIKRGKIVDLFFEAQESRGVKKGSVVDSVELVECVGKVLKALKAKSGINIKAVHTNISGADVTTKHSRAIIPLAERGNKVISSLDQDNVIAQAFTLGSTIEDEVIHQIPYSYTVDNKTDISNPLGLYGHKLEVDLYLVCAKLSSVQTINYAVHQAGYDAKEIFFSGLATSEVVFDQELNKGVNILCDIGSDITEIILFKDAQLREVKILPLGGADLTRALQEGLNIPFELAKDIKISSGPLDEVSLSDDNNQILVRNDNAYQSIKKKQVTDILNAKTKSICLYLKDAVEKTAALNEINHFVLTGRTVLQEGFLEMLEAETGIRVELARIRDPQVAAAVNKNPALSGRKYLTYVTALGLVCKQLYGYAPKTPFIAKSNRNPFIKAVNKLKEVYLEYF